MACKLIYVTTATRDDAIGLARSLLDEKLVACANVLPGVTSLYRWQGAICEESETVLIAKTQADLVPAVIEKVKATHSYDCPCVVSLPIEEGNPSFLEWIIDSTSSFE